MNPPHKGNEVVWRMDLMVAGIPDPRTCNDPTCWCGGEEAWKRWKVGAPRPKAASF